MNERRLVSVLLLCCTLWFIGSCNRSGMRIKTLKPDKDRMENLKEAAKDTTPTPKPPDTLSQEVQELKSEQFNFLTNLILNNMVRAQQAAYDGRFTEAEKLLVQSLKWYPTTDALMLLGSVYEVQGNSRAADSCWKEARRIDPNFDARTSELPRQKQELKPKQDTTGR